MQRRVCTLDGSVSVAAAAIGVESNERARDFTNTHNFSGSEGKKRNVEWHQKLTGVGRWMAWCGMVGGGDAVPAVCRTFTSVSSMFYVDAECWRIKICWARVFFSIFTHSPFSLSPPISLTHTTHSHSSTLNLLFCSDFHSNCECRCVRRLVKKPSTSSSSIFAATAATALTHLLCLFFSSSSSSFSFGFSIRGKLSRFRMAF